MVGSNLASPQSTNRIFQEESLSEVVDVKVLMID